MEKITFLDSIKNIFNVIFSSSFFIFLIIGFIILLGLFIILYLINNKKVKTISLIVFLLSLLIIPLLNISFFISTIDQFMTEVVRAIYFPTYYVYIFMLLFIYVDIFKTFKNKTNKVRSIIKIVFFMFYQLLFFMIIHIIIKEEIDIFNKLSIYNSTNLTSFIQISSYMFFIYIFIKIILSIINSIIIKKKEVNKKEQETEKMNLSSFDKKENDKNKETIKIKENIEEIKKEKDLNKILFGNDLPNNISESNEITNKKFVSNFDSILDSDKIINTNIKDSSKSIRKIENKLNANKLNENINNNFVEEKYDIKNVNDINISLNNQDDNPNKFDDFFDE